MSACGTTNPSVCLDLLRWGNPMSGVQRGACSPNQGSVCKNRRNKKRRNDVSFEGFSSADAGGPRERHPVNPVSLPSEDTLAHHLVGDESTPGDLGRLNDHGVQEG